MESTIFIMIIVSIFLASCAVAALIWGLKGGQFGEQAAFLTLNDSEDELNEALNLERRQKDFSAKGLLILDRDGVINQDVGYLCEISKLKYIDGIFKLAKKAHEAGYLIVVATNQSGIARGYYKVEQMLTLHNKISEDFIKHGLEIRKFYYCPHLPEDNCKCRKPAPKMLLDAMKEFNKSPNECIMLGDKPSDMKAAERAGIIKRYLITDSSVFEQVISENFK